MEILSKKNISKINGGDSPCECAVTTIYDPYVDEAVKLKNQMLASDFLDSIIPISHSSLLTTTWVATKEECRKHCCSLAQTTSSSLQSFQYDHHHIEFC